MNDLLFAVKGPGQGAPPPPPQRYGSGGGGPGGGDLESGPAAGAGAARSRDLDEFFARVEDVKADMQAIRSRQRDVRAMHERSKTIVRQREMQAHREEMQAAINEVSGIAHRVKAKVDALDRANEAALQQRGQGAGSASERTRTSITAGLKRKLKDLMGEFSELRTRVRGGRARAHAHGGSGMGRSDEQLLRMMSMHGGW